MSKVSNRFYVEAIDDGTSLHGQILSTKPLSQAWTGSTAVPAWTVDANRPIIYVNLMNGNTSVTPDENGTWYYNGTALTFDGSTALSTNTGMEGWFHKESGIEGIKIMVNLASNTNVNTDSVSYSGSYTISGAAIPFSASTFIRITGINSSGIFGQIHFVGSNVATEKNQTITMVGRLYSADGTEIQCTAINPTLFTTSWRMNGAVLGSGSAITVSGVTYYNAYQINESQITDNCSIECEFTYVDTSSGSATTLTCSAYENVDDQTDPELLWIQYNGGNDASAVLHSGGSVTWKMWMGLQDDPTVDESYTDFYVKLLKSDASVSLDSFSDTNINNVISSDPENAYYGFRRLNSITEEGSTKYTVTIPFAVVKQYFSRYMTGIVLAEKTL